MGMVIESGGGVATNKMIVDSTGHAFVRATTISALTETADTGGSYCIATGAISLTTTASYSGIFQVKNTSVKVMRISLMCLGGDMDHMWWKLTRNPGETGTLWTTGTVKVPANVNFSSGAPFPAENGVMVGADGKTVVGGSFLNEFPIPKGELAKELAGAFSIHPGNSIAFECKPSAAGDVHGSILVYFE